MAYSPLSVFHRLWKSCLSRTVSLMTREAKRDNGDLRLLLRFIQEIGAAESVEQIYAGALTVVQGLFTPKCAFVALSESGSTDSKKPQLYPGWLLDLSVPVYAGQKLLGQIMLQYDEPRGFLEQDLAMLEIIAAQAGFFIQHIHERKAAVEKHRQKQELIAMAAHELRSPMTAIVGGIHMLRSGRDDGNVNAVVDIVERNAQAQITLIEELLQICQLDAEKVELKITTVDVVRILERVIEDIHGTADANNTRIKTALHGPITLRGDARRLWQIFWNLIANSIRFCPNGELRITADLDSGKAKICIQDDGAGINQDQLPHIFERFRQGHVPRMKSDGLGLGLAIVNDLIALHNGTITAESDGPGKGARFTVILPS